MKITLNETFCKRIWKTHVSLIKDPTRTRKIRELCLKMVQENHIELNKLNRAKIENGIRSYLNTLKEKEIQIEDEEELWTGPVRVSLNRLSS